MKVVLSRKGFDSGYGGNPSPVYPDGTMLSMPIPSKDDFVRFDEISYKGKSYLEIWNEINPKHKICNKCHLDPDIRKNIREVPDNWKPTFGQIGAAQGHLTNKHVEVGDIFLFFGYFQETEIIDNRLRFKPGTYGKHMLYGYLQIGEILIGDAVKSCKWHPHSNYTSTNNTIYVASDKLIVDNKETKLPGSGTFKYSKELVLTKEGMCRTRWALPDCLENAQISYHSAKSHKNGYFQSAARGQEFVVSEDDNVTKWACNLIAKNLEIDKSHENEILE